MNYAGNFDFGLFGNLSVAGESGDETIGTVSGDAAASSIIVNDAQLLFSGDYARHGADLVLSKDGHDHVIPDYFKGAQRKALSTPDGATLSPDLVKALVGEVQVAQAGGAAAGAAQVIGTVSKLTGSATAIRNGVSVTLNVGDQVQKGDVVQAGADSSLTLNFIDGTVFGLSANARMVLNEMVYDPQGSANSSLLSLIQGTITFVAGEAAHNGNMRVDTPVATMGIRGTAVLVEIGFEVPSQGGAPPVKFQVLVEPGGRVGSYFLYNKSTGALMGQVNQAGQVTSITGGGDVTVGAADPLTPIAQAIIQQTLQQYFPNYVPNANPRSSGGGGSTPADPNSGTSPDPLKFAPPPEPFPGQPFQVPINLPGNDPYIPPVNVIITRFNSAPTVTVAPVVVMLPVDKTNFSIGDQVTITDPDAGDVATPYVAGTARIISATGPNGTPASLDLKSLITLDPQTGRVSYDPALFKFLAVGQKAVYVIEFDSQSGPDTTHQTLTFTVDGSNDAPVVSVALTGAVTQTDAAHGFDLLAGASDPDLGETATLTIGTIKYALNGNLLPSGSPAGVTLNGHTLYVDPSTFAYLGAGQTATLVVSYMIIDAQGASVAQTQTITITGTNDAPAIDASNTTATATAEIGSEGVTAQGSIAFDDADLGDTHTATAAPATGTIGSLTLSITEANGSAVHSSVGWTYDGDPAAIAAALIASEDGSITETFTVTINDGHGGSIQQTVTVTIAANVWTGGGIGQLRTAMEAAPKGNWSDGDNWSLGVPPDGTQFVLVSSSVTINLDVTANVGALLIGDGANVLLTASGNGRTLNVTGDVVNHGDITLAPGVTLHVSGNIHNYGQLTIDHHTAGATLLIDDHVTLDGGGTVTLDGSADRITGETHSSKLVNVDNKIDGYGKIGDGHLTLVNAAGGIIAATNFWHGITIDTGDGTFTNYGLVTSASLFGGLTIDGPVANYGTLEARYGLLKVNGAVTGGGHAVIDGGILEFNGASDARVMFSGNTADLLKLDDIWHFTGTVTGFSFGDTINIDGLSWWNVRLIEKNGYIDVRYGSISLFEIKGDYDAHHFLVSTDFHGGANITWLDQAPQIDTDDLHVSQSGLTTRISGLSMFDDDAGRRETFSYKISADGHTLDNGSGRLSSVNGDLADGFTYTAQAGQTVAKVAVTVTDGYGASDTVNFLFGTSTATTDLNGTAGKDVIIATGHNDTLSGGASADQFVFQSKSGQHVITDFATGQDKIELDFAPSSNWAFQQWLANNASQQGADTLIKFGNESDGSLLLKHVDLAELKASDFIHGGQSHGYLLG